LIQVAHFAEIRLRCFILVDALLARKRILTYNPCYSTGKAFPMGFLSPRTRRTTVPTGPSASQIREQEEERIRRENQIQLEEQEARRAALRGKLTEDEDEEIKRKRLFGE